MNIGKKIIHLSDLHFRQKWAEDQGIVLEAFFKDLSKQIGQLDSSNVYIAFSGDVVLSGGNPELYDSFLEQFDTELNKLNIPKAHRICTPGNHDVSIGIIEKNCVEHEGVVSLGLDEGKFNDYVSKQPNIFTEKFNNYILFESKFADYGISGDTITGKGWNIDDNISVYCLNTAMCSSGSYKEINDKGRLAIDTRSLQEWILNCKASTKILIMHHPIEWLVGWAQIEIKKILRNSFSLCLSGHFHDQSLFHSINNESPLVECSAPPLLTNKKGDLGYSIISVNSKGVIDIVYRQWTKNHSFVTGVNFSNTDDGRVIIQKLEENVIKESSFENKGMRDFVGRSFSKRLDDALLSFSSQPKVWVEPVLSRSNGISNKAETKTEPPFILAEFISKPKSTIIKAPPQFGLTCLAHYLAKEAWSRDSSLWLYLDSKNFKWHSVDKAVKNELELLGLEMQYVKCIILDSWTNTEKDSLKYIKKLCELFKDIPIIVMQTIDDIKFAYQSSDELIDLEFDVLHLLSLPRGHMRKIVSAYNDKRHIGDEDSVLTKVISDLEVLNLHRTPLNCLTLLKVSEVDFDESPVNRAEMIKRVLFLLFNTDEVPTYKERPDLKDCEYVLGRFCETMVRTGNYAFTREHFLNVLHEYCRERVIDLEVQVVFDVLHSNNILVKRDNLYCFRFSYWIYYFAAQRMQQDQSFASFIFEDMRYVSYPEIIEFYTGIDRSREDALKILIKDIGAICDTVAMKCGLPDGMNPYRLAQWQPTEESVKKMHDEINESVSNSKLPDAVKDQYADRQYDPKRPFNQSIQNIYQDYSLIVLWYAIKAGSRALRNSDYVDPIIKRELLQLIMRCWEQLSKVLLVLTPVLAVKGHAVFEGTVFVLCGNFGDTFDKRLNVILSVIPSNVVGWFKDDLFSRKMGPLLFDQLSNEKSDLRRHELVLLLISERPRDWKIQVQKYITSISKNSFYLLDVFGTLKNQYRYSYASFHTLKDIEYLIKMVIAKHSGSKNPGMEAIKKIPDKMLPIREVDKDD